MNSPAIGFIFDMDGVVTDNMRIHELAWMTLFHDLGLKVNINTFHMKTAGMKAVDVLRFFLGNKVSKTQLERYSAQKEFLYRVLYRDQLKATAGLVAFLKSAKRRKIPMALATGGGLENINFVLDGLRLRTYFNSVLGSGDVKHGKPHPEIYLKSAKAIRRKPEDCIVFEDAFPGIESARKADMQVVAVATSHSIRELEKQKNVLFAIKDFSNLRADQFL